MGIVGAVLRRVLVCLALASVGEIAQAGSDAVLDGNRLLALDRGDADHIYVVGFSAGFLLGHQQGVQVMRTAAYLARQQKAVDKSTVGLNLTCPPPRVASDQAALVLLRWLDKNPGRLHEPAADLAIDAFAEAWPCD